MSSDVVTIKVEAGKFHIYCPFHLNNVVRNLPNRRWNKTKGCWVAPVLRRNAEEIERLVQSPVLRVEVSPEAREKLQEVHDRVEVGKNREKFPIWYKHKLPPFPHQSDALDFTHSLDTAGYLMGMGTGKSKVWVDRVSCAFMSGRINAAVIACPSSIRNVWKEQFDDHCPVEYEQLVFGASTTDKAANAFLEKETAKLKVLVIAVEGLQVQERKGKLYEYVRRFFLSHRCEFGIDESHNIKGHDAVRSKNCVSLSKFVTRRSIMTGTAMSHSPMDLYMQFEFLNPDIIGIGDFYSFRNRYCIMGGYKDKQVVAYDNIDELTDLIRPWVFQCEKSEVLDLPEKLYTKRFVELSPDQKSVYKTMAKDSIMRIKNSAGNDLDIVAENVLTEYALLQEISGGFVYYKEDGKTVDGRDRKVQKVNRIVEIANNPKIREMINVIDMNPNSSVIIWSRFSYEIEMIREALEAKYGAGCASVYNTTSEDLEEEKHKFNSKRTRFFVANQASGSIGLTLNVSDLTIYYSNTLKLNDRSQSEDRNHRIGQTKNVLYVDLVCSSTVDEDILESIRTKQQLIDFVKNKLRNGKIEDLFK